MRAIVIAMIAVLVFLLVYFVCGILYVRSGLFKLVYHDIFKWHEPDYAVLNYHGTYYISRCKYCGKHIARKYPDDNWIEF
jgi:intracellular septation protein A